MKTFICVFVFCLLLPMFAIGGSFLSEVHQQERTVMEWFVRRYILALFEISSDVKEVQKKFAPNGIVAQMSSEALYMHVLHDFYRLDRLKEEDLKVDVRVERADVVTDNFSWKIKATLKETTKTEIKIIPLIIKMVVQCDPLMKNFKNKDFVENPFGCKVVRFEQKREDLTDQAQLDGRPFNLREIVENLKPKDCGKLAFYSDIGTCAFCLENLAISATSEECNRCPNRKMKEGLCVLSDCGEFSFADKIGNCYPCHHKEKVESTIEECDKCPERKIVDDFCLPPECGESFFKDKLGNCYSCNSTKDFYATAEECGKCPNRVVKDDRWCIFEFDNSQHIIQISEGEAIENMEKFNKGENLQLCDSIFSSKPCLLYMQNSTSHDVLVEDFFEDVSKKTQSSIFKLKLDNSLYQKQVIKPGYFAEIIVPLLVDGDKEESKVESSLEERVEKISKHIVSNNDIKTHLGICGDFSLKESCLFYVQNKKDHDVLVEDFFKEIAKEMQCSLYRLRLDNSLYQKQVIKPGYFAEIIIPVRE